ncbi:hypothetical protein [Truepera radiovictrix]|uniref:Uncharacterized protein n=1 Tax=Truepera radiovictrix (strain DSM 17093 / CIP 108686 / LMG 22925 / RQ-24) TaxID=649638 RepID=D7CXR5_TRURR|nr:hypothetical protein [Truepera radiovictrix]ADI14667.1 hypothetical protein Trad_1548 [Truepera radiovictrix DSM 17093]WMT56783.1 hypothetical protein RCV51_12290 [Truepera radiovictrix]
MTRAHWGAFTPHGSFGWLSVLLLLGLALSASATATTFRERSLDELFRAAEIGFYGTVRELSTENRGGDPYTLVTFEVARAFRGVPEGAAGEAPTVQLAFLGGTLPNGQTLSVAGMPEFALGDEVLVLAYDAPYYSPIVGFSQGLWRRTPSGLVDPFNRTLALSAAGTLVRGGDDTDVQAVLAAVQRRLSGAP